eukprot:TRINITY_DN1097_c0_g1_i3.p1 TRINITY_DN1097_c0_g1~~TRINITY_DN1097_c0_g1_i3.p1  ORF type:complete len:603 (-),score=146.22 TRINITY_DN1097_c0_g1_i3:251-2059(-)
MKLQVFFLASLVLGFAVCAIPSSETDGQYAEMAAHETDEWTPKHADAKATLGDAATLGEAAQGKAKEGPSPEQTRFDAGADINNPTSLFPGPTNDLPGYKVSHNWLDDIDYWSPLVFDWKYYKARCSEAASCKDLDGADGTALKDMNEGQIKKYWLDHGMKRCDVASPTFNAPYYVASNPDLWEDIKDTENDKPLCKKAIKQFLTKGVFDGLSGTSYDGKIITDGASDSTHWKPHGNKCLEGCANGQVKWDKNFAWTFWYMRTANEWAKVRPVFALRRNPRHIWDGWWGGFPFFITWVGSMMFCAQTQRWECHWPIGEVNSGVKGGWRFNWYHRWRLPPVNWWRFYGVMSDEDGYSLYEFSDPPIEGNSVLPTHENGKWSCPGNNKSPHWPDRCKTQRNLPYTVHGFSRRIPSKQAGGWWGWDIHKPYSRPDGLWSPSIRSSAGEAIPEDCAMDTTCTNNWHCRKGGWHTHFKCRIDGTLDECGWCKTVDSKVYRAARNEAGGWCRCKKKWDEIEGVAEKPFTDNDAVVWTGYTYSPWILHHWGRHCGWMTPVGHATPQYIMDLTYYRLGDHSFTEEEMKAIYLKGRSIDSVTGNEVPTNRY